MRFIFLLLLVSSLSGCAAIPKTKNGKKRFAVTLTGMGAGAAIGALSAPEDEKPEFHAFAWGAAIGLATKLVADYVWGDHHELADTKKEFLEYREKNDFIKIDEKLGYMTDSKNGKQVKVIYEVHKGRKFFPVSDDAKYIAETFLKVRPLSDEDKVKEDKKK